MRGTSLEAQREAAQPIVPSTEVRRAAAGARACLRAWTDGRCWFRRKCSKCSFRSNPHEKERCTEEGQGDSAFFLPERLALPCPPPPCHRAPSPHSHSKGLRAHYPAVRYRSARADKVGCAPVVCRTNLFFQKKKNTKCAVSHTPDLMARSSRDATTFARFVAVPPLEAVATNPGPEAGP